MSNTDVVLECDPFELTTENHTFRSRDSFTLSRRQIAVFYGLSEERVEEFLYLLGGLYNIRGVTTPAKQGQLVREDFQISTDQLRFVRLLGKPLYEYDNHIERAQHIGFIFENPELFIIGNTVIEEFQYSFRAVKQRPKHLHYLGRYGLEQKAHYQTETLSGGERHRLNCAAVLELSPDLLIADFSNSNLDPEFTLNLIEWLQDIASTGSAVLLTGLQANNFSRITPTTYGLEDGNLIRKTPSPDYFPEIEAERGVLQGLLETRSQGDSKVLEVTGVCIPGITPPVSFSLKEREILLIRGPNGSGKTSLGKILSGRIRGYEGRYWHGKHKPAMSLQYPERSFLMNSVEEELNDPELLQICGITAEQKSMHPRRLSRSQQKLLSIAITLKLSAGYAILDEPTAGMDSMAKKRFIHLLNRFKDKAVLVITHDNAISFPTMTKEWSSLRG